MERCPTFQIFDLIGKEWTIVLLQEISLNGEKGFNFILKRMRKVSPRILSKRLKDLERNNFIERMLVKEGMKRSIYRLTGKGEELLGIINNIKSLCEKYSGIKVECASKKCVECELY